MASAEHARPHPSIRSGDRASGVRPPRPAGLLTGAAAVPLGAAVLYAGALMPGGARLVLGLAVVLLGLALRRTAGTVTGARLGPATARGLGLAVVLGGAALVGGALASISGADLSAVEFAGGDEPVFRPWGALILLVTLAAAGAWAGRSTPEVGGPVLGVTSALIAVAVLTILGAGHLLHTAALTGLAVLATVVALRGRGPRTALLAASVGAATLVVWTTGDAFWVTEIVRDIVPVSGDPTMLSPAAQAVHQTVGMTVVALLAVTAGIRRDPAGGLLSANVLLSAPYIETTVGKIGVLVVPIVGLVTALWAVGSEDVRRGLTDGAPRAWRDAGWRVDPDTACAALAATVVVLAVALTGVLDRTTGPGALVTTGLLAATAVLAWRTKGLPAVVAATLVLLGLGLLQPLVQIVEWRSNVGDNPGATTVALVVGTVVASVGLLRRVPHLAVALAATFLVMQSSAFGMMVLVGAPFMESVAWVLGAGFGISTSLLVVVGILALVAADRLVAPLQAIGAVLAFLSATAVLQSVLGVVGTVTDPLAGSGRLVAVLLLVGLTFGCALLAASTARRTSVAATLGAVLGAGAAALLAATISAATAGVTGPPAEDEVTVGPALRSVDLLFGNLRTDDVGWPVMLAIVGLVLVVAGAWLESRRPLPAHAPVARR